MNELLILILACLLCLTGMLLSVLTFSGTWLVLAAAVISRVVLGLPDTGILVVFFLLCITIEVVEALASLLGVQRRGGSKAAGFAALIGGFIGAAIGNGMIPVLGAMTGLLTGSFTAAFLMEWLRLRHHRQAAHIAWGAVFARLLILFLKTTFTLGMSLWLLVVLIK